MSSVARVLDTPNLRSPTDPPVKQPCPSGKDQELLTRVVLLRTFGPCNDPAVSLGRQRPKAAGGEGSPQPEVAAGS